MFNSFGFFILSQAAKTLNPTTFQIKKSHFEIIFD